MSSAHWLKRFCDGPEFVFEVIECLCTVVRRGRPFGRDDPKDIVYDAEVGGVLYFQDEHHRAINNSLYEVCGYGPAIGPAISALDTAQCVLKVGAKACSVLADWGWPGQLLRPLRCHSSPVAVDAGPGCWLFNWRLE